MVLCECGGGSSGAGAGFPKILVGSCGNAAVRIGGLCGHRSVIDRGADTLQRPSHSCCADRANRDQDTELPIPGPGVLPTPTPEAGVRPSPENLKAAGRPAHEKEKAP